MNLNIVKMPSYDEAMSASNSLAPAPAASTGAARPTYHHGDLEQALISRASEHVHELGAQAVSLRKVAQDVGTSPSAAYSHFPDKAALLMAVALKGMTELDARMQASALAVAGDDDSASIERFWRAGDAYIQYAVECPHMFRHIFGPACAKFHEHAPAHIEPESASYDVLCAALDDLDERGLLRRGTREGLDLLAWTTVHGFAALVLDGFMPADVARSTLFPALARLALTDDALALGQAMMTSHS